MDPSSSSKESKYRQLDETLLELYHAEDHELTAEERESLTPILDTLESYEERYVYLREVGSGGEKRVSEVYDNRLDRKVAMAHALQSDTPEKCETFLREARLTANLAHPNIMPIHNVGMDPKGVPYFTMELIATHSLADILFELREHDSETMASFSLDKLISSFLEITHAVAYAHSRGVLHLDLKLANIRIGEFGEVFVGDWGSALVLPTENSDQYGQLDPDLLNTILPHGLIKGTAGYMSPEQIDPKGKATVASDIYALGSVLYRMLALKPPFEGASEKEVLEACRKGRIQPLQGNPLNRPIPRGLAAVAMKAMERRPQDRYATVQDMTDDIYRYLSGHPTKAEGAGPITALTLLIQRHNRITFVVSLFLLILSVGLTVSMSVIRQAQLEAEEHFRNFQEEHQEVIQLNQDLQDAMGPIVKSPTFLTSGSIIAVINTGVSEDMDRKTFSELMVKKGTAHFLLYQFHLANAAFEQAREEELQHVRSIQRLSQTFAAKKENDEDPLTNDELAELIQSAPALNLRSTRILYYTYLGHLRRFRGQDPEEHLKLSQSMLNRLNRLTTPQPPFELEHLDDGLHLNLSESFYSEYTLKIDASPEQNVLEPLNLVSLDLSGTPLRGLSELYGLTLNTLILRDVKLPMGPFLTDVKNVKINRLIVSQGLYSDAELYDLRRHVEVVEH